MMSDTHDHRNDTYESLRKVDGSPVVIESGPISPLDAHHAVNHPKHYTNQVRGVEAWDVLKYFPYLRGNALKYLWRAGDKDDIVQDLRKAIAYIEKEIEMIEEERYRERGKI